jgi:hypothetical protein
MIAAIVVGGVVCIIILIGLVVYCRRRRKIDILPIQYDFETRKNDAETAEVNTPSRVDYIVPTRIQYGIDGETQAGGTQSPEPTPGGRLGGLPKPFQWRGDNDSNLS